MSDAGKLHLEDFRGAFSKDWQEHVLGSIGLGRNIDHEAMPVPPQVQAPQVAEIWSEEEEDEKDPVERSQLSMPELELPPALSPPRGAPATPLAAPSATPLATPLPSPMLEVPPTPITPLGESPRLKPLASPGATPAVPSPMWQPVSEALLPTPALTTPTTPQRKAEPPGTVAPPTPMSIFAEAPKVLPLKTTPSPKPLDLPEEPGSAALLRLLWPAHPSSATQMPKSKVAGESECVLKALFRMPDFHDILLEGIGVPKPPTEGSAKRQIEEGQGEGLQHMPYAKRYRRVWEILAPPFRDVISSASAAAPKLSRYEKLGVSESGSATLFGHIGGPSGPSTLPLQKPGQLPGHSVEKRKRLGHSEVTQFLWGRVAQSVRDRRKAKQAAKPVAAKVFAPLPSKKRWSGKSAPTAQELSLRTGQPFVLYEYVEENPTVMMNMGMCHQVLSYFLPRRKTYEGETLGPLQCKTPMQINGPLPHLLASQIHLKPGQGVSVLDSSVLQAPLVSHEVKNSNRFLLVWNKSSTEKGSKGGENRESTSHEPEDIGQLHLRPLHLACVVGQVEPSRTVPGPRSDSKLRASCVRHMLHQAQQRWQKDFSGEVENGNENDGSQILKAMVRDVSRSVSQWFPDQGPLLQAELKDKEKRERSERSENFDLSEQVCLLDAMRRGEERLQSLGIDQLYQADSALTKALQDLEFLERRRGASDDSQILRARWILEQLQITPWNLAGKYAAFMKKGTDEKKGSKALLSIAGPGDPSNGRLEGVSFLPVLVKHAAECLALSKVCFGADRDIAEKLQQHGVSEETFEPLTRWDRIALLCTKLGTESENLDCPVTGWSRTSLPGAKHNAVDLKKKHSQLLQDAFQRQLLALTRQEAKTDDPEGTKSILQEDEAALFDALEDSPDKDDGGIKFTPHSEGEDDKAEMERLRKQLGKDEPSAPVESTANTAGAEVDREETSKIRKVKMLKVVTISLGKMGQVQERVLYVFGEENIRLYREIHAANEMGPLGPGRPMGSGSHGEGGLTHNLKMPRGSTLSRVSEQSRSTKGGSTTVSKKKSRDDERVSSCSKNKDKEKTSEKASEKRESSHQESLLRDSPPKESEGPSLKALDRSNLLKRRKTLPSDSGSKVSRLKHAKDVFLPRLVKFCFARHGEGFQPLLSGGAFVKIYAPHARQVSVAAAWSAWIPLDHLTPTGNGWWELNISSNPSRDYLFQVGSAYKIFIVSENGQSYWRPDPWSRKQDGTPLGNSLTYFDEKFQWSDSEWSMPEWKRLVIYEFHVGTFCAYPGWIGSATLDMCIQKLDYLLDLGVNAVELMPVAEFDGTRDWGYTTAYPFAVEESYGGPDAFKRFVNACHQKGIAVLLDVVYNHLGPMDLPLWQFDGWSENGLGGAYFYNDHRAETPWAHTRPNYGLADVRRYLIDSALFWLQTMHCDGLRVDGVSFIRMWGGTETNRSSATFNPEGELFLKELSEAVRATGKLLIAEDLQGNTSLTEPLPRGLGFHSQWDGLFHWKVMNTLKRRDEHRKMSELKDAILADLGGGVRRTVYVESHDEAGRFRLPLAISGQRDSWVGARLSAMGTALVILSPGIPLLFQGQEFAQQDPFSAFQAMDWSQKATHQGTYKLHQDLIRLRRTNHGFLGTNITVTADEEQKVLTVRRWNPVGGGNIFAIFNFRRQALANYPVELPSDIEWNLEINTAAAQYYNSATIFQSNGNELDAQGQFPEVAGTGAGMFLHPYSCMIYTSDSI